MTEPKTKPTDTNVDEFLDNVENPRRRQDGKTLLQLMKRVTNQTPKMWGTSIIGFGSYTYRYASGRKGIWPKVGFSPRKRNLALYILPDLEAYADLLKQLGKYKTGKSCLYINKLDDVDPDVLEQIIMKSIQYTPPSK
jgi:hypothetical protein